LVPVYCDTNTREQEVAMRKSIAAVVVASAALAGCQARHEDGGPTVSRNYQVGNFQQIEIAGPYDVEIRTGGTASVSAQGPEKMIERLEVAVEGNKLVIRSQHHGGWFHFGFSSRGNVHFVVTVPQLESASLLGSGDMKIDKVQGQSFEGAITGSGDLSIATVDVQSLKLSTTGSGGMKAGAGKAQSAEYEISGSGDVDASAVDSAQIKASIAGSGDIKAHGSGTANVDIMGSGDFYVTGGAKCQVSKAGSGDAHCS
jgi:hypothetical protein